jgi:hypothetical protein
MVVVVLLSTHWVAWHPMPHAALTGTPNPKTAHKIPSVAITTAESRLNLVIRIMAGPPKDWAAGAFAST